MRWDLAICLFVALSLSATPARAQTAADQARIAFERGQRLVAVQQFEEALRAYRDSYRLNPASPSPLAGIGLCLVELDRDQEALEAFDHYLDLGRHPETRRQAEEQILQILGRLGWGTIRIEVSPAQASVSVDDRPAPENRLDRWRVPSGSHTVAVRAPDFVEASQEVTVSAQQVTPVSVELTAAVPTPPTEVASEALSATETPTDSPTERQPVYRRWWFWTIIGVVVAGGVATGLGLGLPQDEPPDGAWRLYFP